VVVAEEPGPHALDVLKPGRSGALAHHRQHRGGDVDGHHAAHVRGGGTCQPPGARAEIHQRRGPADALLPQHREVLGGIWVALLAVESRD
jgi:hypothetical protein